MKKIVTLCLFLAFAIPLSACETVKGVGRDLTSSSEAVQGAM